MGQKQQTRRFFSDSFWFIEKLKKFVFVDSFSSVDQNQHQNTGGSSWTGSDIYRCHPHSQFIRSQVGSDRVRFSQIFFCFDLRQRQTHQNHQAGSSAAHRTISLSLGLSLAAVPAVNDHVFLDLVWVQGGSALCETSRDSENWFLLDLQVFSQTFLKVLRTSEFLVQWFCMVLRLSMNLVLNCCD